MNDVTFFEASRKLAERMMQRRRPSPRSTHRLRHLTSLARLPERERQVSAAIPCKHFEANYRADPNAAEELRAVRANRRSRPGIDTAELAAYAAVASLILNLDETVTKE